MHAKFLYIQSSVDAFDDRETSLTLISDALHAMKSCNDAEGADMIYVEIMSGWLKWSGLDYNRGRCKFFHPSDDTMHYHFVGVQTKVPLKAIRYHAHVQVTGSA